MRLTEHVDILIEDSPENIGRLLERLADADRFSLQGHGIAIASKASLIGWKSKSVREKDKFDAMALRQLQEDPKAFD